MTEASPPWRGLQPAAASLNSPFTDGDAVSVDSVAGLMRQSGETDMVNWREYLATDPRICSGQLCARGTRVLVTVILDSLAEGATREQILGSYPSLPPHHIDAALACAAELAREESLLPLRAG